MNIKDVLVVTAVTLLVAGIFGWGLIYQLDIEAAACEQQR